MSRPYVDALLVSITDDHGRLFRVRVDKIAAITEMAETRTSVYMFGGVDLQVEAPIDDVLDAFERCGQAAVSLRRGATE